MEELNCSYRRNLEHNYLVINYNNENIENYQVGMLRNNRIEGLLPLYVKHSDNKHEFCYETDSVLPLTGIFAKNAIKYDNLILILSGLVKAFRNIREYLLDENSIILNPKFIYADIDTMQIKLISYPFYESDYKDGFMELAEFLLEKIEHNDNRTVMVAYGFFKMVKNESICVNKLEKLIEDNAADNDNMAFQKKSESVEKPVFIDDFDENADIELEKDNNLKKEIKTKIDIGKSIGKGIANIFRPKVKNDVWESKDSDEIEKAEIPMNSLSLYEDDMSYGKTTLLSEENDVNTGHYLIYKHKGREKKVELDNLPITVGKASGYVDVVINDSSVSRMHATLFSENDEIYISDCNSTNGTIVNGIMLSPSDKVSLDPEDEIRIGKIQMTFY